MSVSGLNNRIYGVYKSPVVDLAHCGSAIRLETSIQEYVGAGAEGSRLRSDCERC